MPRAETEIQADIDRLRAALGNPDARVSYEGGTREAKSHSEIMNALSELGQELETVQSPSAKPRSRRRRVRTRSGW